jgi:hypothetical protein
MGTYPKNRKPSGFSNCPYCGESFRARGLGTHIREAHKMKIETVVNTVVPDKSNSLNTPVKTIVTGVLSYSKDYGKVQEIIRELNSMVRAAEKAAVEAGKTKEHWSPYVKDSERFQRLCRRIQTISK